jgi:ketosteroid isomerase-like protein
VFGRVRFRAASTGDLFETEVADFIEVKDGRIVSLTKFCDTALAAYLMAPAEQ